MSREVGVIDRSKTGGNPWDPVAEKAANLFGTHVAETILGAVVAAVQTGHMTASDPITNPHHFALANSGAVHIWVPFPSLR